MKVLVLGSGVIGVTTAYFLAERGHEVTVIERQPASAMETSFANGGQLSYSHAEPWASPAVLPKIIKWLLQKDSPLVFYPQLDLGMWIWCVKFLLNCNKKKLEYNTVNALRLALYSRKALTEIREKTVMDFNYLSAGVLHIFKDQKSLDASEIQASFQKRMLDCPYEVLDAEGCFNKEPVLRNTSERITGGIFFPLDESGDVHYFTKKLATITEKDFKVMYKYNTEIQEILTENGQISGVKTNSGILKADRYIVSLGSYAPTYTRKIGINLPIYPMKGYSISIPCNVKGAPRVSITDQSKKIVYSRLGGVLRAAGTAEFSGYNTIVKKERIESMKSATRSLFPNGGDYNNITEWACLRPQTPQGTPIMGKTKYGNLFLNTGHGTLGWTMAAGSAKIVADLIEGKEPDIELTGLTL